MGLQRAVRDGPEGGVKIVTSDSGTLAWGLGRRNRLARAAGRPRRSTASLRHEHRRLALRHATTGRDLRQPVRQCLARRDVDIVAA